MPKKFKSGADIRREAGLVSILVNLLPDEKEKIVAAAKKSRMSVNQFIIQQALMASEKILTKIAKKP